MENSIVQLETPWTLDLGSVGGEHYHYLFLLSLVRWQCLIVHRFGRICPGRRVAHSLLTITAASVLSTFDLVKKVDENGRVINPKREYSGTTAVR